jgi:threonine aldolase
MNFRSDNILGCAPEVVEAMARVNETPAHPYGNDPVTARLGPLVSDIFEHEAWVFPVSSGTAANGLALAAITPPWGAVFCHPLAHMLRDEWCAPEFFTGGARLLPAGGPNAKLDPSALEARIRDTVYAARPATVTVTQATEAGTVYQLDELRAITDVARHAGLAVHMDGARFSNAVATLNCAPADLTWRTGVDALALGAAKNGTMTAEAVVVFRQDLAEQVSHRRKRAGHVSAKMRFLSAQLEAFFTDDLWLRNARAANLRARQLADGLTACPGVRVVQPVDANLVFVAFPPSVTMALRAQGFEFLDWPSLGEGVVRLACGFSTPEASVQGLVETVEGLGPGA